jgi:transglutaminase-like putative cysteine protease
MRRISLRAVLALLLFANCAPAQQLPYKLEVADVHKVSATITYEIRTKEYAPRKWMMFLHEPPETPSQSIAGTKAEPEGQLVTEKSPLARKVRYIEVNVENPAPNASVKLRLDIEATLRSRKLVKLADGEKPPPVTPLTETERKYYLAPSLQANFDAPAFRDWLDAKKLHLGKDESPLDFAERILEVIRADVTYYTDPYEAKTAAMVCKSNKTDCVGMSLLFVGAMRASSIPARLIVGRIASPNTADGLKVTNSDHPHVKAEMYLPGIGWVPVDASYANGNKGNPVKDYIGNDPGDLLILHVDCDLKAPFPDRVRNVRYMQLDAFYVVEGDGKFDGYFGRSGWEMKSTPLAIVNKPVVTPNPDKALPRSEQK